MKRAKMDGSIQDLVRQVKEHLRTLYGEKKSR